VYAAVQCRVRQALQQSQQIYPDQKGKPNSRPTARWVFQSFIDISVLRVSSLKTFVVGLTTAQKALLTLLATAMSLYMPIPGEGFGMAAIWHVAHSLADSPLNRCIWALYGRSGMPDIMGGTNGLRFQSPRVTHLYLTIA